MKSYIAVLVRHVWCAFVLGYEAAIYAAFTSMSMQQENSQTAVVFLPDPTQRNQSPVLLEGLSDHPVAFESETKVCR